MRGFSNNLLKVLFWGVVAFVLVIANGLLVFPVAVVLAGDKADPWLPALILLCFTLAVVEWRAFTWLQNRKGKSTAPISVDPVAAEMSFAWLISPDLGVRLWQRHTPETRHHAQAFFLFTRQLVLTIQKRPLRHAKPDDVTRKALSVVRHVAFEAVNLRLQPGEMRRIRYLLVKLHLHVTAGDNRRAIEAAMYLLRHVEFAVAEAAGVMEEDRAGQVDDEFRRAFAHSA